MSVAARIHEIHMAAVCQELLARYVDPPHVSIRCVGAGRREHVRYTKTFTRRVVYVRDSCGRWTLQKKEGAWA